MKKVIPILSAVVLLLLCSCRGREKYNIEKAAYPCTVGNLSVCEAPERVAVANSQVSSVMDVLGLSDKIVAEGSYSERGVTVIGTSRNPDTEAVIASGASLFITDYELPLSEINTLSDKGVRTLVLLPPENISEIEELFISVDKLFFGEGSTKYRQIWDGYLAAANELKTAYSGCSAVYITNRELNDTASLSRGILGYIFDMHQSREIASANPRYIFCGGTADPDFVSTSEWYESTPASDSGNVFSLPENFFDRLSAEDFKNFGSLLIKE